MANPEHLEILRKGVVTWNQWRQEHPQTLPDLSNADRTPIPLGGADLSNADLSGANLRDANLNGANLNGVNLTGAFLLANSLVEAKLRNADLSGAIIKGAAALGADLAGANLSYAEVTATNFCGANFSGALLREAVFCAVEFFKTDFRNARLFHTVFADTDLSEAIGLDSVNHIGPSSIGIDTFLRSGGKIPEVFFRGAGVPDIFIEYASSLAGKPIEFYSAFISYSSKDEDLAKRLYADLQAKGVRCWFAPEDLKIGDKSRAEIDRAIRVHDKLLLLLSANSILSDWVEKEVETAFDRERRDKRTVLFPVRLDTTIMDVVDGWAADIRRSRHIGDFTQWKDHDAYQKAFDRLLRDLKAGAKPPEAAKKG
jgi:uncharacterized protein YjbI with pentapeptide repeats